MGEVDGGEGGEGRERHRGARQQVVRQVQVGEPAKVLSEVKRGLIVISDKDERASDGFRQVQMQNKTIIQKRIKQASDVFRWRSLPNLI